MTGETALSNASDEATELTNAAGVLTPILKITPDARTLLAIREVLASGSVRGVPVYADLQDSNGDDLPFDTSFALGFESPRDDNFNVVSEVRDNIQPFRARPVSEQQNEEYIDAGKVHLKGDNDALVANDADKVYFLVESSAQIDWSNSRLLLDQEAVTTRSEG